MIVTSLVENTSQNGLAVEHGLSLYIQLACGRKILFDMGQGDLFALNAGQLGLSIPEVQYAVVSHGHYDHGGGLKTFLDANSIAKVYLNRHAFEPHYSLRETGLRYIGLDLQQQNSDRLVFCHEEEEIDAGLLLFSGVKAERLLPAGNRLLFGPDKEQHDDFCHEQNLLVHEGDKTILFAGCAHTGIVNIMKRAQELSKPPITHVFAGMHLVKSGLDAAEEAAYIRSVAEELLRYKGCHYVTMHCTGVAQYERLKLTMGSVLEYMSCGDTVSLP